MIYRGFSFIFKKVPLRPIADRKEQTVVDFLELERRLVNHMRELVRCGEWTERRLALLTGLSQPHIHNVLKGRRSLSRDSGDVILHALHLDLRDLLDPAEDDDPARDA